MPALIAWQVATLAPFTWMMWRLAPRWETILLTHSAPVTLICLTHGHYGVRGGLTPNAGGRLRWRICGICG